MFRKALSFVKGKERCRQVTNAPPSCYNECSDSLGQENKEVGAKGIFPGIFLKLSGIRFKNNDNCLKQQRKVKEYGSNNATWLVPSSRHIVYNTSDDNVPGGGAYPSRGRCVPQSKDRAQKRSPQHPSSPAPCPASLVPKKQPATHPIWKPSLHTSLTEVLNFPTWKTTAPPLYDTRR